MTAARSFLGGITRGDGSREEQIRRLRREIREADAIVIGLHPILPHVQADALGRIGLGRDRRGRCRRLGDGRLGARLAH